MKAAGWKTALGIAGSLWLLAAGVVAAAPLTEINALVIGIDDYRHAPRLEGAANDARDIAAALRRVSRGDIRLLLDDAADRDTIMRTWDELIAKATPGSTLVFSYAGHGAQMPELVKGSEEDGLDEFLVLSGFDVRGPGVHQKIIDDEIAVMLTKATGLNVVFISDSCHSGTMTRGLDPRGERPRVRAARFAGIEPDPLVKPDPVAAFTNIADLRHVTFFAAVADHEEAPEVSINGDKRGALSWSFARALEGAADANGDGVTTKEELEHFIRENVRMKVAGRQHPQVTRGGLPTEPALPTGLALAPSAAPPAAEAAARTAPLLLHILNPGTADPAVLLRALGGVALAAESTPGRFVWDVRSGEVVNPLGDVVADVSGGDVESQLGRMQGVIDKWLLVRALERDAETRSLDMRLEPGDAAHRRGARVTLVVSGQNQAYFTLFNLSADGTINYLYPMQGGKFNDPLTIPAGRPYTLQLDVTPPFGADHFVAIASAAPLPGLHESLRALDGKPEAAQVTELLARHLAGQRYQLGITGVYTVAR